MSKENKIDKYFICSCCGKYKEKDWMVYIKPETERDTFFLIDSLCRVCVEKELDKLTENMPIPSTNKRSAVWLKNNIFEICPMDSRVETILFLCGIIINYRKY